jgi:SpoVK/Ycf46/Vps4 family AAA+-type ATPase
MQTVDDKHVDVPLFYTKQLIKELCIYPLGCELIKTAGKMPANSILFSGPSGTGKTHAALSVAYHTDALFMDLSPNTLAKFTSKQEVTSIVAKAFRVARRFQPAVLYFDCAEQVYSNPKAKGSVKNPYATRLKKLFITYKNLITPNMRVMFIGNTNRGWTSSYKDLKKIFDRTLYFSLPSFSDSYKLWKREIKKKLGRDYELEYDILAQMSIGFTPESVKMTNLIIDHYMY